MTIFFADGYDTGGIVAADVPAGNWSTRVLGAGCSVTAVNAPLHHGGYCANHTVTATAQWASATKDLGTSYASLYWRLYFASATFPPNGGVISFMTIVSQAGASVPIGYLWTTGTSKRICVRNAVTATNYNTVVFPGTWTANQYYCAELYCAVSDAAGIIMMWLDGNLIYNITGIDTNDGSNLRYVYSGINAARNSGDVLTVYTDCCVASNRYIGTEFQLNGRSRFVKRNRNTQFRRNDPNPYYPQYPPRPDHVT